MFSVTSACLLFLPRLISLFPWAPHHFTPSPLIYFFPFSSIHLSPSIPVTWPSRSQPLAPLAAVLTSVNPRCPSLCWESTRPPHHPASLLLLLLLPFASRLHFFLIALWSSHISTQSVWSPVSVCQICVCTRSDSPYIKSFKRREARTLQCCHTTNTLNPAIRTHTGATRQVRLHKGEVMKAKPRRT